MCVLYQCLCRRETKARTKRGREEERERERGESILHIIALSSAALLNVEVPLKGIPASAIRY